MPAPEQLGIVATPVTHATTTDWSAAHRRLHALDPVCFQVQKTAQGGYRVTCLLATVHHNRSHRVEAEATTEADALRIVLDRAESWVAQKN